MSTMLTTRKLAGLKVVDERKGKRIGKVRSAVFHPQEKRCIGLLVKRPDAALMFHRKDLFVALGGFRLHEGKIIVSDDPAATDKGAIRALGVDWDTCVIWVGMPIITVSGETLGFVDTVWFDADTGAVVKMSIENGAANNAIVGTRVVPAGLVRGFKRGTGAPVVAGGDNPASEGEATVLGAILVSDEAVELPIEGGAAAAAGKATALVTNKAKQGAAKAKLAADERIERAKPAVERAAKKTGEAVDAGSFAFGKQIGKASGMFSAFKEEFEKAAKDAGEDRS